MAQVMQGGRDSDASCAQKAGELGTRRRPVGGERLGHQARLGGVGQQGSDLDHIHGTMVTEENERYVAVW